MHFNKDVVINLIKKNKNIDFKKMVKLINLPFSENSNFSKFLNDLVQKGEIALSKDRKFTLPIFLFSAKGILNVNAKNFGFVNFKNLKNNQKEDIFISQNYFNGAIDGDEVEIDVYKNEENSDLSFGIIRNIFKRNRETFVGRIFKKYDGSFSIKPLNQKLKGNFVFVENENNLAIDMEVKVKIVSFEPNVIKIELEKILGSKEDVSIDILAVIEDSEIPTNFSFETYDEAKKLPSHVREVDLINRRDLRNELIVTIDGDDTKDFDDAVKVEKLWNGNFKLGVYIADVSFYVKENNSIDIEALKRGTSIYLADRVIPMLPEELSNGICSLNPNVDRLVIGIEMEIGSSGETIKYEIFEGIINSKYRLTYQNVNKFFRQEKVFENEDLQKMLLDALSLSKIIRKSKEKDGYIDFEIEESKLIIDELGRTKSIIPRERFESEMLIEDFMVRANETIAYHVSKENLPFIFRVHDKPDLERVKSLQNVIKILGINVSIPHNAIPKEFAKTINEVKKTRFDDFIKIMLLRTMSKAEYSPKNIKHFGLASDFYTHFTSPIRRYPDLIVHRMLREYFFTKNNSHSLLSKANHFSSILNQVAEQSSSNEIRAMELERKVLDIKKAEFYEQFIGQKFEGIIVSIMSFGFFVEFPNKVEGLVHISTLIDNKYELVNKGYTLAGLNRKFTIGDKVSVIVVNAVKDEGKIDLVITDLYDDWKKKMV